MDELTRRYGDVILACVRGLGATAEDARELAAEALARTVDACDRGAEPGPCWLVPLLGEARYLAAGRAGTGRRETVAPGFLYWLDQRAAGHDGLRAALSAAEEESLLLRSFAGLTEPWAAQLWCGLVAPPGSDAPLRSDALPGSDAPPVAARRTLADAYVRLHVATVPERRCRHLAAALAEQAAGDGPATAEAVRHLARCPRCGTVLADLAAVHHWDADHLLRGLLIRFDAPAAGAVPVPVPPAPRTADSARSPRRATRRPGAAGGLPAPVRRWGVGAVAGMGLAVVVLALPPGEDLVPDPPAVGTPTASGPSSPVPAAPSPAPVAGRPLQTSLPTPSVTGRRSGPAAAPSRTPTAALPSPVLPTPALPSSAPPAASAATSPTPTASPTTTPATTPTPTAVPTVRTLRRGDTGSDVVRMQDLLIRADCVPESVPFADGGFDDATARFLRSFQRAAGIAGKEFDRREYGPQSRQALEGAGDRAVCSGA
ncbi:peptidoglycan-binding domain-containing protein [Kitasatospora purpeofusca]|uniref:peptidoglycan-binding domain-containing protein n=1 Tax=Kitasatospora purpeofusca TaxID=67352 RepID=UPI003663659F